MKGRSIAPGTDPTLQFHPDAGVYELCGSGYPLFRPEQMQVCEATKTMLVDFSGNFVTPFPPHRFLVLQTKRRLGPNHQLVWFLGEFDG